MKVFVGMSGGVDSSLTAALLVERGYDVTGVYMKNWSQDLPGMVCPWKEDYQDAKRVAVQLGIPFRMYDFQTEYRQRVVDYMLDGYRRGITPNPDIMCNQEVKFKLFLETALADGADAIATGHYARVKESRSQGVKESGRIEARDSMLESRGASLHMAADTDKDQTYFLYRVTEDALKHSLMPIGEFTSKAEVRAEAEKRGLTTARKKDSQGICFVGKVGIKEFLLYELGEQEPGDIVDQHGVRIGQHDGALFYTIGQRQGLGMGGGLPYYVTGKDMTKNEVYVTTNIQDPTLWQSEVRLTQCHWINHPPTPATPYAVRTRHRAPFIAATISAPTPSHRLHQDGPSDAWNDVVISFSTPVRAVTAGQSAVVYDGDMVLGGGIIV